MKVRRSFGSGVKDNEGQKLINNKNNNLANFKYIYIHFFTI